MSDSFNGYHVWLGIPPKEQPPNHYRLLGISVFESDRDVIDHAADRQMAHVRTFQAGRHGPLSQQILNELSIARLCLLNAEKKAAYDQQLRAMLAAAEPTMPVAKALPVTPTAVPRAVPVVVPTPGSSGVFSRDSTSSLSAGDSSVLAGRSGATSPGSSNVHAAESSSVLAPGDSAVISQAASGVSPSGASSIIAPGKSGVVSPGGSGVLQPGKSGTTLPGLSAASPSGIVKAVPVQPVAVNPASVRPVVVSPAAVTPAAHPASGGPAGIRSGGAPAERPVAPVAVEVDDAGILPLDMALADVPSMTAESIRIRGKRRSFRQGTNWQRPLLMGLAAAALVTCFVLLYYLVVFLASPEFKKMFDEEFGDPPATTVHDGGPAAAAPPAPAQP